MERQQTQAGSSLSHSIGLADQLYDNTRGLHRRAERSGIVHDLLRGRASRESYALLLRNLLPAYQELERGLDSHRHRLPELAQPALYRSVAIEADLRIMYGEDCYRRLPLLPAGRQYGEAIRRASSQDGVRLIAHAYTRYLGDLNGGRLIRSLLVRHLKLEHQHLSFYLYPGLNPDQYRHEYRNAINRAGINCTHEQSIITEAIHSFRFNIHISDQVAISAQAGWVPNSIDFR